MTKAAVTRMTQTYIPTLKEDPAGADLASHRLLLRAGFIRKCASGLYSYLPLAMRSLHKIEEIIREEMAAIGCEETLLPILTPAELWHESGRWKAYGPELMRLSDRHERAFCLGPTHEETITDLIRGELKSYRQLPLSLFQIQTKFRDEIRPRFGLMRGREFIMKDGYSFHASQESLQTTYEAMKDAYAKICERCSLKALPVVADSGQIGGDTSVEFMALAEEGEAALVWVPSGFAADVEAALGEIVVEEAPQRYIDEYKETGSAPLIKTPEASSLSDLADFLQISTRACRKSYALIAEDGSPVLLLLPGDHELNETKAEHLFGSWRKMNDAELSRYGLVAGFMGAAGVSPELRIVADQSLKNSRFWLMGANKEGYHGIYQLGYDFEPSSWEDLFEVRAGDLYPKTKEPYQSARGIEVSQVFQLGDKYSRALGACFTSESGKEEPFIMGCYGIGVSRTLAAIIEQHFDEAGIVWPVDTAPYQVHVLILDPKNQQLTEAARKAAEELSSLGLEVLLDDRAERPGVKFNDADLIGLPVQLVFGKRSLEKGSCEIKVRKSGERRDLLLKNLSEEVQAELASLRAADLASCRFDLS